MDVIYFGFVVDSCNINYKLCVVIVCGWCIVCDFVFCIVVIIYVKCDGDLIIKIWWWDEFY